MAHSLGMDVVAEGIETRTQLGLLEELNCDFGQGFLFARAMDKDVASNQIREHGNGSPFEIK